MSATKFGLPSSLTPDLLSEILRYEPRHWRALQQRLSREHPDVWDCMNLSDEDFYARLHALLKNPVHRRALASAAQGAGTKNRPLTLCDELHRHYSKSRKNDPSLTGRIPRSAKPREIVDALLATGDDDRLANIVWAFAESGDLGFADLSRISEDYPEIRKRLAGSVKGIQTEAAPLMAKWAACLSRMRDTLDAAEDQGPNSGVVERLAGCTDELRALASESERSIRIWESLVNLVEKHRHVLSGHTSLKPYAGMVDEAQYCGECAQDAEELLEEIDRQLLLLTRTDDDQRKTAADVTEANPEQRTPLIWKLNQLNDSEAHHRSETERLLRSLA